MALANTALGRWRRLMVFAHRMTTLAWPASLAVRYVPETALSWAAGWNDTWSGVAGAPGAAMA